MAIIGDANAGPDSFLATDQIASWDFMQSAGGIRIGTPRNTEGGWVVPVVCDISGLSAITKIPSAMNSGLAVTKILYQRNGSEIDISVVMNSPLSSNHTANCPEVVMGEFAAGKYEVSYKEANGTTHPLGTFLFK